jgi:uncharacterized sulfatase
MKQSLFERSARNPLIVAGPGVSHGPSPRVVELLDVYPTLADLAGLSAPAGLQGRSLKPLLKDPKARWDHPALTQVRRGAANNFFMGYSVRTEKWRYTEWDEGKQGTQLYDEQDDSSELRNLAADPKHVKTVAEMQQLLRSMRGK